jgi:membrane protease YdiL (CAAX protease family)
MTSTREIPVTTTPTRTVSGGTGPVGFMRRRPLTAFLAWFFTVGQALVFAPIVARAHGVELHLQLFVIAGTLIGLLLPAVVITRVVDGPEGVRDLWRRSVDNWVTMRWYVLALAGVPVVATGLAIAFFGTPTAGATVASVGSAVLLGLVLQTAVAFVPNNWAEEVVWTGFFQSRLQERTTPMRAAALTAPVFALQHVVLVVGTSVGLAVALMLFLILVNVPIRALMGWTYNRTGSLFFVGFLHAAGNGAAGGSGFSDGFLARLYPGETFVGLMHLLALALIGLVVITVTRGALGRSRGDASAAEPTVVP